MHVFDVFILFYFSIGNQQTQVQSELKICRDRYVVTLVKGFAEASSLGSSYNASFQLEPLLQTAFHSSRRELDMLQESNAEGASAPAFWFGSV